MKADNGLFMIGKCIKYIQQSVITFSTMKSANLDTCEGTNWLAKLCSPKPSLPWRPSPNVSRTPLSETAIIALWTVLNLSLALHPVCFESQSNNLRLAQCDCPHRWRVGSCGCPVSPSGQVDSLAGSGSPVQAGRLTPHQMCTLYRTLYKRIIPKTLEYNELNVKNICRTEKTT